MEVEDTTVGDVTRSQDDGANFKVCISINVYFYLYFYITV